MKPSLKKLATFLMLATVAEATQKPNILILYTDDVGYADVSHNNGQKDKKIITPHIDKLAKEGMHFTDGHSSATICTPSRYALLTGRYHWRKVNRVIWGFGEAQIAKEEQTLPEMLKAVGYQTGCIGKWHLGWDWEAIRNKDVGYAKPAKVQFKNAYPPEAFQWDKAISGGPCDHGFDYYFGDDVINMPPYCWFENDRVLKAPDIIGSNYDLTAKYPNRKWGKQRGPRCSGWDPFENIPLTTQKGVDFIKEKAKSDKPFFLYFSYPSPHLPHVPNKEFVGKSQCGLYGDYIVETDDSVGRLLKALEESGEADNTIVIFTADNGCEGSSSRSSKKHGHDPSYPLSGSKRSAKEGGHRVPFIIKMPGVVKPNQVSDALISQVDLMKTLATLAGATIEKGQAEDSLDFTELLKGKTQMVRNDLLVKDPMGATSMRLGDWVLVGSKELFNIKEDIGQKNNLAEKHPDKIKELREARDKLLGKNGEPKRKGKKK